jgi:hypothetical protein
METWGSLLTDIRADLQDSSEKPRWANDTLYVYAKDALRDYSLWFPRRIDRLELVADNGKFPLPSDFIEDILLECPADTFLERRMDRPGVKNRRNSLYYFIQGGSLYFAGDPLGDLPLLTYLASHPVPPTAAETTFELTVPDSDLELVRLYVKAKIYGLMRSKTATLDRYKPVGDRQDNPLQPETEDLWGEYYAKIAQRIPGGVVSLYRAGRVK